jgi:hypothetical protein
MKVAAEAAALLGDHDVAAATASAPWSSAIVTWPASRLTDRAGWL